jgi:hypothetical protein
MKERLSINEQLHESITCTPATQVLDERHTTDSNYTDKSRRSFSFIAVAWTAEAWRDTTMRCENSLFLKNIISIN